MPNGEDVNFVSTLLLNFHRVVIEMGPKILLERNLGLPQNCFHRALTGKKTAQPDPYTVIYCDKINNKALQRNSAQPNKDFFFVNLHTYLFSVSLEVGVFSENRIFVCSHTHYSNKNKTKIPRCCLFRALTSQIHIHGTL